MTRSITSYRLHTDERREPGNFARAMLTVPIGIRAFMEATSLEHAVRLAISAGGDTDTQACITGAIAAAR